MIVSRPQSPKGPSAFCKLRPIATPVGRNDEMRKDQPRPFHSTAGVTASQMQSGYVVYPASYLASYLCDLQTITT